MSMNGNRVLWRVAGALAVAHVALMFGSFSLQQVTNLGAKPSALAADFVTSSTTKGYAARPATEERPRPALPRPRGRCLHVPSARFSGRAAVTASTACRQSWRTSASIVSVASFMPRPLRGSPSRPTVHLTVKR